MLDSLSRNTKRRIVFYGGVVTISTAFVAFCTAGRSFRGVPPPLDAREAAYARERRENVEALAGRDRRDP